LRHNALARSGGWAQALLSREEHLNTEAGTLIKNIFALSAVAALAACGGDRTAQGEPAPIDTAAPAEVPTASLAADWDARLDEDVLDRGRRDEGWRRVVELDSVGEYTSTGAASEEWDQISPETVNRQATQLPLYGDVAGPSVVAVQVLLDRALFSPGIIDGYWGKNAEKAAYWFQQREGLRRTGRVDTETFERLVQVAGAPEQLVRRHTLSAEEVEGPFVTIPEDIYDKAKMDCLCYESLTEKLGELFHTSPAMLRKLNPDVSLDGLAAGDHLWVPNIRSPDAGRGASIERLVVSGEGHYVHALDAAGRIVFHFPSTLGSTYDPSPEGDFRVTRITKDPWWHYQPAILAHVDDDEPDAKIPPGPNNAVGAVWMALSIPHYGIHGTSAPETIGYATSAGCVRLTNWDALFLADRISSGVAVEFRHGPQGTSTD
jgi:lipoprotein-anchoring transpeptidase ErfK/SrfK